MLTSGVVALLNATAAVTSICGNSIQPIPAPDDLAEYPCVTYQIASDVSQYSLTDEAGPTQSRIVFNCIAPTYLVARSLALAIKGALTSFTGTLSDGTYVNETQIVNIQDAYDDGSRLSTTSVHAVFYYAG